MGVFKVKLDYASLGLAWLVSANASQAWSNQIKAKFEQTKLELIEP